ncbi:hypothetical protein [Palleronia abyssalis]|uniref:Uncharacterized protein n=1 Tax=Palleronia abyssalis TaxID=1501240 RepID=A0A2R8C242_9RHOB|nr:hypothetical protein [Palleronia abyssalis]SPJ26484.1 hypothetical protein PAA8504_04346 [Palleronia abyssalis]
MKVGEFIHVCGTVVAIGLGGYAIYSDWINLRERLSVQPAEVMGNFYLTRDGVSQEVEFVVVNEGRRSTVIQRVDISPGGLFPDPVLIDGKFWDGRPFSIEPHQVMTFRFLAEDRFETWNTSEAREAAAGEPINLGYLNLFNSFNHRVAVEERMDLPLHARNLEMGYTLFESFEASEFQKALFSSGRTFAGDNKEMAQELASLQMNVTFGGPCLSYMVHTLSVCAGMELTTLSGNTFASEYIGFGLRSHELDGAYRQAN